MSIEEEIKRQAEIRKWDAPNLDYVISEALSNLQSELLKAVEEKAFYLKHGGAIDLDIDAIVKVEDIKATITSVFNKV